MQRTIGEKIKVIQNEIDEINKNIADITISFDDATNIQTPTKGQSVDHEILDTPTKKIKKAGDFKDTILKLYSDLELLLQEIPKSIGHQHYRNAIAYTREKVIHAKLRADSLLDFFIKKINLDIYRMKMGDYQKMAEELDKKYSAEVAKAVQNLIPAGQALEEDMKVIESYDEADLRQAQYFDYKTLIAEGETLPEQNLTQQVEENQQELTPLTNNQTLNQDNVIPIPEVSSTVNSSSNDKESFDFPENILKSIFEDNTASESSSSDEVEVEDHTVPAENFVRESTTNASPQNAKPMSDVDIFRNKLINGLQQFHRDIKIKEKNAGYFSKINILSIFNPSHGVHRTGVYEYLFGQAETMFQLRAILYAFFSDKDKGHNAQESMFNSIRMYTTDTYNGNETRLSMLDLLFDKMFAPLQDAVNNAISLNDKKEFLYIESQLRFNQIDPSNLDYVRKIFQIGASFEPGLSSFISGPNKSTKNTAASILPMAIKMREVTRFELIQRKFVLPLVAMIHQKVPILNPHNGNENYAELINYLKKKDPTVATVPKVSKPKECMAIRLFKNYNQVKRFNEMSSTLDRKFTV